MRFYTRNIDRIFVKTIILLRGAYHSPPTQFILSCSVSHDSMNTVRTEAAYLREKLSKKLGVSLPLDKAGVKKLKAQRQELTEQNESLRPKLGQIRAELDQLSKLRYWTRKAIPDALPEREDFAEQMEVRENRRELEQVMNAAIDAVTQETDELQPMTERSSQEKDHGQER